MNTTITTPAGSVLPADDNTPEKVPAYNQAHLDLEKAVYGGPSALNVAALTSPYTMSAAESRGAYLESTGARGSALTQIVSPTAVARTFHFFNNGVGQTITVKVTSGGTGVTVANNERKTLTHDGTNVYAVGANPLSGMTTNRIQRALSATTIGDGALADDGTNIALVNGAGYILFSNRTFITSPADGNLLLRNNAQTSFGLLQFGGTTNAFPALKRVSGELHFRLADDLSLGTAVANDMRVGLLATFSDVGSVSNNTVANRNWIAYGGANRMGMASGFAVGWVASGDAAGALDTDLTRAAAAVIKAGNGSTGYAQVRMQSLGVNNSAAATTPGSVVKKIEVFDVAGASLGFLAVYSSIA